ncbi:hypothetical protein [Mycolicibacterium komossense]|uniref:Uncharacterized protein n=1 Tax=Mycolicibacterium komossense TaxID=1779 RepID=A0ABT3CJJ0_9MYCO|nr:hypothetical protein [Mycolicibacterium komossense]MCV7229665.1 hypothetical protein [Mycolicibacterium komossense]
MSAIAVFFVAVGIADICRRVTDRWWPTLICGPVAALGCALVAGLWHFGDLVLVVVSAAAVVGWVVLCARTERDGTRPTAPLLVFGAAIVILGILSGWASPAAGLVGRWLPWVGLNSIDPTHAVLVVGVVLVQLVTGNQLVRLILGSVGAVRPAGEPQPSDRLKGGRLLGPMERLLILCLGLAGQLAAATAVIAAKGIIRFPELNAQRRDGTDSSGSGIDEVTEYFLVGSFASWLLALAGVGLV